MVARTILGAGSCSDGPHRPARTRHPPGEAKIRFGRAHWLGYFDMRVSLHSTAGRFLLDAECFLRSDPFSANVIAVIAGRIAAGSEPDSDDHLWATVTDRDHRVLGVAMQERAAKRRGSAPRR